MIELFLSIKLITNLFAKEVNYSRCISNYYSVVEDYYLSDYNFILE